MCLSHVIGRKKSILSSLQTRIYSQNPFTSEETEATVSQRQTSESAQPGFLTVMPSCRLLLPAAEVNTWMFHFPLGRSSLSTLTYAPKKFNIHQGQSHNMLMHFSQRINYDFGKYAEIIQQYLSQVFKMLSQCDIKIRFQEFILREENQKDKTKIYQHQKSTPSTQTCRAVSTQHSESADAERLPTSR